MKQEFLIPSKENLIKEFDFFKNHYVLIDEIMTSNRQGFKSTFKIIESLVLQGMPNLTEVIELDTKLIKLNTQIAMSQLNEMTNHSLELKYITRLPALLFKLHINKLKIIKSLKIDGHHCQLLSVPPQIGYLNHLEELFLSDCLITKLPPEISLLKKLTKLNCNGNRFSLIPKEIGQLKDLKELDISNNELIELPLEMQTLIHLEKLNLRHNKLKKLLVELANLPHLEFLDIQENDELVVTPEFDKFLH